MQRLVPKNDGSHEDNEKRQMGQLGDRVGGTMTDIGTLKIFGFWMRKAFVGVYCGFYTGTFVYV